MNLYLQNYTLDPALRKIINKQFENTEKKDVRKVKGKDIEYLQHKLSLQRYPSKAGGV